MKQRFVQLKKVKRKFNCQPQVFLLLLVCMITIPVLTSCTVSIQIPLGPANPELSRLMETAKENGTVRIMVTWKMDEYKNERYLAHHQIQEQRETIIRIQQEGIQKNKRRRVER